MFLYPLDSSKKINFNESFIEKNNIHFFYVFKVFKIQGKMHIYFNESIIITLKFVNKFVKKVFT